MRRLVAASGAAVLLSSIAIAGVVLAGEVVEPIRIGDGPASLNIRKTDIIGTRLAGAVFSVEGVPGTFTTGSDGLICLIGFENDSLIEVTEVDAPDGYELANPASQEVEVDDTGDCNSPDAIFVNPASTASPTPSPTASPIQAASPAATPRESTAAGTGGPPSQLPNTATDAGD